MHTIENPGEGGSSNFCQNPGVSMFFGQNFKGSLTIKDFEFYKQFFQTFAWGSYVIPLVLSCVHPMFQLCSVFCVFEPLLGKKFFV